MTFCIFYGHLVYFVVILGYSSSFGMLCQEKSGNPGDNPHLTSSESKPPISGLTVFNCIDFFLTEIGETVLSRVDSITFMYIQGCQRIYFQTKNHTLGQSWKVLQRIMLVYYVVVWYIFSRIGMLHQEKFGIPDPCSCKSVWPDLSNYRL
jgi:hypothetical protein